MQPSDREWVYQFEGITNDVYEFGNGYGALHTHGTVQLPDGVVPKNELHPLEFPRFAPPFINYNIHPQIDVTDSSLAGDLEKLKALTS